MAAISLSSDPESRENYGPYVPNIGCTIPGTTKPITYGDKEALREAFEKAGRNLTAFLVEPIQGEAGIVVPDEDYLRLAKQLCADNQVLLVCDEIQTGIARTGRLLCHEWSDIKPDMVLLGKAISGGMYPVSCVLGWKEVMLTVEPGTHGSTYGGNPLGCAVAMRALEVVREENMVEQAQAFGQLFRDGLEAIKSPIIQTVRGRGLLNAIVIDESKTNGHSAWDLCMLMKQKGLLVRCSLVRYLLTSEAKPTHQNIIRLAPPLVITRAEIATSLEIITAAVNELPHLKGAAEDQVIPPPEKKVKITVDN